MEARRVQKLGQASLVVTLPKEWVKRVGLKPGDTVYIMEDGETLRILPGGRGLGQPVRCVRLSVDDLSRAGVRLEHVVRCAYMMGYESVLVEGGLPLIAEARRVAGSMSGVEVLIRDSSVEVRSLVDVSRLDVASLVKSIASLMSEMVRVFRGYLQGGRGDVLRYVRSLYEEALRLIHLANKKLIAETSIPGRARTPAPLLIATALTGLAAGMFIDSFEYFIESCGGGCRGEGNGRIADALERMALVVSKVFNALARNDAKAIIAAGGVLHGLKKELRSILGEVREKPYVVLVSRMLDIVETLLAVNGIAVCLALKPLLDEKSR